MTSSIITSDRYIAILGNDYSIAFKGIVRILSKDGRITPARWNATNCRLESCAINEAPKALPMYGKSAQLEARLMALGLRFAWLTPDQAKELAS